MGGVLNEEASASRDGGSLAERAERKRQRLESILEEMGSVVVAFSGGVDSGFLAYEAWRRLGDRALAVIGESPSYSDHQRRLARRTVQALGIPHLSISTHEMASESYRANNSDRCFHCKSELFTRLHALARERGFRHVADGANADDRGDFRPGRRAAEGLGVRSPLDEAELTKEEIRYLSRQASLPTADEPASACLSSRIPYLTPITVERLRTVEKGEQELRALGFRQFRVRHHDKLARLEFAPEELPRAFQPDMLGRLVATFKSLGYQYVTVDLEGYRTGSLNETLAGSSR